MNYLELLFLPHSKSVLCSPVLKSTGINLLYENCFKPGSLEFLLALVRRFKFSQQMRLISGNFCWWKSACTAIEDSKTPRGYAKCPYNFLLTDAVREILCSNFYWVCSKNCENLLFASSCLSLRLDFREIYLFIFRNSVEKIQV